MPLSQIKGIGVDIISFDKIKNHFGKTDFIKKTFTKAEIDYAENSGRPIAHLATAFAAKEAFFKALGTGWLADQVIEIQRIASGRPQIIISDKLKTRYQINKINLSLSFCGKTAIAFVVIS